MMNNKTNRRLTMAMALTLALSLATISPADAQDKTVGGTFEYHASPDLSINAAKMAAIENARIQAIAAEFGSLVSQHIDSRELQNDGRESSQFLMLNATEVKGEWLADTQEPTCELVETLPDLLILRATVKGKARPISNEATDFEASVLRNGTEPRYADVSFREGDDMYVSFKSPISGYVAIYLIDETPTAFCLLPYSNDTDGQQPVVQGRDYVFFSPQHAVPQERSMVDEMTMTCSNELTELNQVYVIFSPNPFTKAVDEQLSEALPRQLSYKDFTRWLSKNRRRDAKMGVKIMKLAISRQQ